MSLKVLFYDDEQGEREYYPDIFRDAWLHVFEETIEVELASTPEETIERLKIRGHQFQLIVVDILQFDPEDPSGQSAKPNGILIADYIRNAGLTVGLIALTNAERDFKGRDIKTDWQQAAALSEPGKYGTYGQAYLSKDRFRHEPLISLEQLADTMARVMEDAGVIYAADVGSDVMLIHSGSQKQTVQAFSSSLPVLRAFKSNYTFEDTAWLENPLPESLHEINDKFSIAFLLLQETMTDGMKLALGWCLANLEADDIYLIAETPIDGRTNFHDHPIHILPQDPEDFATFIESLVLSHPRHQ